MSDPENDFYDDPFGAGLHDAHKGNEYGTTNPLIVERNEHSTRPDPEGEYAAGWADGVVDMGGEHPPI